MNYSCPKCGYKNRIYEDTFSFRCPQCSIMVAVPREEVEETTSLIIRKKKKKVSSKSNSFSGSSSKSNISEDIYGSYKTV